LHLHIQLLQQLPLPWLPLNKVINKNPGHWCGRGFYL
jgi:hypothetical protein